MGAMNLSGISKAFMSGCSKKIERNCAPHGGDIQT